MDDKIKIGIFGDSQASLKFREDYISWVDILKLKYNIINYAEPGSSLFFSFQKFIKFYKYFDKIIFLVTSYDRLLLPNHSALTLLKAGKNRRYPDGIISYHAKSNTEEGVPFYKENVPILDAIKKYYVYIHNEEKELCFSNLMIEEMKRIRPDGLYYNFWNWTIKEDTFYKVSGKNDLRSCHLTETNNKNMARYLIDWIDNKNGDMDSYYSDPIDLYGRYFS